MNRFLKWPLTYANHGAGIYAHLHDWLIFGGKCWCAHAKAPWNVHLAKV